MFIDYSFQNLDGRAVGRPRSFDEDVVLGRAMDLFWQRGYGATSLDELVEHIGIGRQSLYNTFGDKHALFLKALDRYVDVMVTDWLAVLEAPDAALPQIQQFLTTMCSGLAAQPHRACFMVNTTMELAMSDPAVGARAKRYMGRLENAFFHALGNARAAGQLKNQASDRALARHLSSSFLSLNLFAKAGSSKATLKDIVSVALAGL